ncbi:MAG TPA: hypothetical protein VKX46_06550 [Ktedonobacteraceae bacterium]|nr:hypothetical protein [Ktedonobacteraceae bacterium]
MPKTKAYRSGKKKRAPAPRVVSSASAAQPVAAARRPLPSTQSLQSLVMSGLVALGCWGFAYTFAFLTSDPNRYVFGGMAALIALMWSIIFGVRLQKWQRSRQA